MKLNEFTESQYIIDILGSVNIKFFDDRYENLLTDCIYSHTRLIIKAFRYIQPTNYLSSTALQFF